MVGGAGRGNKGVCVIDDDNRPTECRHCGGFMKSHSDRAWRCTECKKNISKPLAAREDVHFNNTWGFDIVSAEKHARKCEKPKRLIVTSAQNNSAIHDGFLKALNVAAGFYKAQIAIVPSHYKNVTLYTSKYKKEWCDDVAPYLVKSDIQFGNVLIRSDVKINATTAWPLAGKSAHGGRNWVVFAHPQIACEPVASPSNTISKKLFTTGSCTLPNYSISDAGCKAEFHHVIGALIIERHKNGMCFVRQINASSDGSFYDLDNYFTPDVVTSGHRIAALTTGDEHVKFNACRDMTYDSKDSVVNKLQPEIIVRHDILDGYAGSHHHKNDAVLQFKKHHNGDNNYRAELDQCINFINETTPDNAETWIVPSNHHDHFFKFLQNTDLRDDHTNALLIAEMNLKMRLAAMEGKSYDPFYLYCKDKLTCLYKFLDRNEPALIGDVDHSQHFDIGVNGSKGSAKNLAKTCFKMTGGHSHSARIVQGVYQAGTSTNRMEYERGLSDHSITHVVQYADGKRTLIDLFDWGWKL